LLGKILKDFKSLTTSSTDDWSGFYALSVFSKKLLSFFYQFLNSLIIQTFAIVIIKLKAKLIYIIHRYLYYKIISDYYEKGLLIFNIRLSRSL